MKRAANMDNPAPDNDASVKSLGIFLLTKVNINNIKKSFLISRSKRKKEGTCIHKLLVKFTSQAVTSTTTKLIKRFTPKHFQLHKKPRIQAMDKSSCRQTPKDISLRVFLQCGLRFEPLYEELNNEHNKIQLNL